MVAAMEAAWMRQALALAARGRGATSPNPMVGALVVKDGAVVGTGWHRRAGTPHAEYLALQAAGARAEGSTVFVTLEPCVHHGRTPPCVEALAEAKVARVVASVRDPDLRTAGSGFEALRRFGIEVQEGVLEAEARKLNEAYFHHRLTGRPFVTYKVATTLDGKTAAADGSSRWITGERARRDAHRLRGASDAICAGVGTILADDPLLTAREVRSKRTPLRVVVDSDGRTPPGARVLGPEAPTTIFTALEEANGSLEALRQAGASVISAPGRDGKVDLSRMLEILGDEGVVSLLLEGGAKLAAAFAARGLIDKYVFYVASKLLGIGRDCFQGWGVPSISDAVQLTEPSTLRLGPDIRITAYPAG
jgi:diaminohydroxyphosphoribosylaminopyrimidine deaminase/5-amino-6-(5-phosphoribosylamino)uracil reductase